MKRILLIAVVLVISISLFAQKDVTKFLGIPIDGFKPEMIQKLKEKGFVSSASDKSILEEEFNGTQVSVINQMGETDIKIRFNKLSK